MSYGRSGSRPSSRSSYDDRGRDNRSSSRRDDYYDRDRNDRSRNDRDRDRDYRGGDRYERDDADPDVPAKVEDSSALDVRAVRLVWECDVADVLKRLQCVEAICAKKRSEEDRDGHLAEAVRQKDYESVNVAIENSSILLFCSHRSLMNIWKIAKHLPERRQKAKKLYQKWTEGCDHLKDAITRLGHKNGQPDWGRLDDQTRLKVFEMWEACRDNQMEARVPWQEALGMEDLLLAVLCHSRAQPGPTSAMLEAKFIASQEGYTTGKIIPSRTGNAITAQRTGVNPQLYNQMTGAQPMGLLMQPTGMMPQMTNMPPQRTGIAPQMTGRYDSDAGLGAPMRSFSLGAQATGVPPQAQNVPPMPSMPNQFQSSTKFSPFSTSDFLPKTREGLAAMRTGSSGDDEDLQSMGARNDAAMRGLIGSMSNSSFAQSPDVSDGSPLPNNVDRDKFGRANTMSTYSSARSRYPEVF